MTWNWGIEKAKIYRTYHQAHPGVVELLARLAFEDLIPRVVHFKTVIETGNVQFVYIAE